MNITQACLLGLIQGFTEFLPISSSGHLVIFQKVLGVAQHDIFFDVAVHLGTLFSVLTVYSKTISRILIDVVKAPVERQMTPGVRLFLFTVVATIPTAIFGFTFKDFFEELFSNPQTVGGLLMVTGVVLYLTKNRGVSNSKMLANDFSQLDGLNFKKAFWVGLAQGVAIAPGISRSGSTIASGILLGVDRSTAAMFSFMLAIPAILGASLLQVLSIEDWSMIYWPALGAGVLVSYLSGLFGLWIVLHFVRQGRLQYFSYYLWGMGALAIAFF